MGCVRLAGEIVRPGKVICVGRNFPGHVREMGGAAPPAEPVIFLKPATAIVSEPTSICVPEELGLLHHEVELCALIGPSTRPARSGRCRRMVDEAEAARMIAGYAVGIDLTLRELQSRAKAEGGPWDLAKGFDSSAAFGSFVPASGVRDPMKLRLSLSVNGEPKQQAPAGEMIFGPAQIISFASRYFTLEAGDVIMCGTPAGVGALNHGDAVSASAGDLPRLEFAVVRR